MQARGKPNETLSPSEDSIVLQSHLYLTIFQGHQTIDCKNPKAFDLSKIADKTTDEAWAMLTQASEERDITDFKEAVQILSKAIPEMTYVDLEKECRKREFTVYLIATVSAPGFFLT